MNRSLAFCFSLLVLLLTTPAHAQLRGHGGPVRGLAVSQDGTEALSGSFNSSAIRWSLRATAPNRCCASMMTP